MAGHATLNKSAILLKIQTVLLNSAIMKSGLIIILNNDSRQIFFYLSPGL
jgi:hypothetical protein